MQGREWVDPGEAEDGGTQKTYEIIKRYPKSKRESLKDCKSYDFFLNLIPSSSNERTRQKLRACIGIRVVCLSSANEKGFGNLSTQIMDLFFPLLNQL